MNSELPHHLGCRFSEVVGEFFSDTCAVALRTATRTHVAHTAYRQQKLDVGQCSQEFRAIPGWPEVR